MSDCQFGQGKCAYGIEKFSNAHQCNTVVEELIRFREAYCNPCLEARKIYALEEIKQELAWSRQARDMR